MDSSRPWPCGAGREAVRLGIDRPTAQFPFVDPKRCIGCGSCVNACPEGDVLGIVGGTATVLNGLRCVGHGRCEVACPVGAIEVGLGDLKSRQDVPLLDRWQESTVPGLFIAGELAGLALVKNAIQQGRKVVDRVAQQAQAARRAAGGDVLDLLVVGGRGRRAWRRRRRPANGGFPTASSSRRGTWAARSSTIPGGSWSSRRRWTSRSSGG